jgi:hypothetical protein
VGRQLGKYIGCSDTVDTRRWRPGRLSGSDNSRNNNGFRQRRGLWGRVDGGLGVPSCNTMNAEYRLRQWVGGLSVGRADERITINK